MTITGEIMFLILVYLNVYTLWCLGPPWTYRQRKIAWYLSLTAWSFILFDGGFLAAVTGLVSGVPAQVLILVALSARIAVSVWLVRMIRKGKEEGAVSEDP